MEWLNLHTSTLDSPAFLGADPLDRATWVCLLRYSIGQENSGIIDNCADWPDRKWQQLCRVTLREVRRTCDLFEWLDGSLIVKMYPVEKEKEVKRLRSTAKAGAAARWNASRHADGICHDDASRHAQGMQKSVTEAYPMAYAEGKGREGKGREGREEGKEVEATTPPASQIIYLPDTKTGKDRLRAILTTHGSTLVMKGNDIFHEWVSACKKHKMSWIEKTFQDCGQIALPSDLRDILKRRQATYQSWLDGFTKKAVQ